MVELGALYRLCVSVCTVLLKKVVSPSDCKISNVGNAAVWDGLVILNAHVNATATGLICFYPIGPTL